jgi:hypothetical protein
MSEELTAATSPRAASSPTSRLSDPKTWVGEHGNYLFHYALIRVRNETVAEDLVQDTLSGEHGQTVFQKYDRDFWGNRVVESVDEVLAAWWRIVTDT